MKDFSQYSRTSMYHQMEFVALDLLVNQTQEYIRAYNNLHSALCVENRQKIANLLTKFYTYYPSRPTSFKGTFWEVNNEVMRKKMMSDTKSFGKKEK